MNSLKGKNILGWTTRNHLKEWLRNQNVKMAIVTFLKLFKNGMIRNIKKIYKNIILLEFQNLWNLISVFIQKNYEIFFYVFPMIFQSLMGLGKSGCDIPSGPPKDAFTFSV